MFYDSNNKNILFLSQNCSVFHYVEEAGSLDYCDVITVFISIIWMDFKLSAFDIDVVHISFLGFRYITSLRIPKADQ